MKRAMSEDAKAERREAILSAALNVFFQKGFSAARMDDIAAKASVSKGTLYLYFNSKEAVFEGLIESVAMPNLALLEGHANTAASLKDALDQFAKIVPMVIRKSDMPRLIKVIIGDAHMFPHIVAAYRENILDHVHSAFAQMLRTARARGEIIDMDADQTARLFMAPFLFTSLWHAVFSADPNARLDIEDLMQTHVNMVWRALQV